MLQFEAILTAILIGFVGMQTLEFNKQLNAYNERQRAVYEMSNLLEEASYDYEEDVVYDSNAMCYNTYDYYTILNSYAVQEDVMPCDTIIFGSRYLKKQTAADESSKVIFSQLRMSGGPTFDDRFILVRENKNEHWYYINTSALMNIYGKKMHYIDVSPDYKSGSDYSTEKFNLGNQTRFDLYIN